MIKFALPVVVPVAFLVFCSGVVVGQDGPETVAKGTKDFRKRVVVSGLAGPWEITLGPDKMLWVTERTGKRVTRIDPSTGEKSVAITIDEAAAPGGQDGVLGMALHPELLKGTGNDYVYVAYTYNDTAKGPDKNVSDARNPYRFLYGKIVRLSYNPAEHKLSNPVTLISGLPAGNDHNAGRLKFGPDKKLYFTIGDQGHNQLGNYCLAVESQRLPTQKELDSQEYSSYVGKSLRINLDGSAPKDNPKLEGVVSHVFTYGHRNPQGIDFGPDGTLYSSEQGPKTDDEVNILKGGSNYGWPHVSGLRDNKAYEFARWAEASPTPCSQLRFSDLAIHLAVPREAETAFKKPMADPIATMFTVPSGYNFHDPACKGIDFICWPTVGASSIEYYGSKGIPGWDKVLLVTTLKRGSLYVLPLKADGKAAAGHFSRYFHSENRFRDTAVSADGKTIFVATDPGGLAEAMDGSTTRTMQDKGSILAFTYIGEGTGKVVGDAAAPVNTTSGSGKGGSSGGPVVADGTPAQFTATQAAAGKTAYNANCAVCHGSTMTNGTFGTPLAGEYFKTNWSGRLVRTFLERAQKTMPPAAPGSLPAESYANIVAYIMEVNGIKAGGAALPPAAVGSAAALGKMVLR